MRSRSIEVVTTRHTAAAMLPVSLKAPVELPVLNISIF